MNTKSIQKKVIVVLIVLIFIISYNLFKKYKKYMIIGNEVADISKQYLLSILTIPNDEIAVKQSFNRSSVPLVKELAFVGAIPIDVNNDGKEALFVGGGTDQEDVLLINKDGNMVNIIEGTGLSDSTSPTHGGVSIDMDKDGYSDLIIARQNGVTLYKNNKDGTFSKKKIVEESSISTPVAVSVVDYNKDGKLDIYVSRFLTSKKLKNFQFNNPAHSQQNIMLKGIGGNEFIDTTKFTGVGGLANSFTSVFTDLDNDGDADLIIAQDAGEVEFYENKNGKFIRRNVNSGFGFWMGIAVADIDNDGDQDIFLTNVSDYSPIDITKGTGKTGLKKTQRGNNKHILLRNDGNFKFVDITKDKMKTHGFGWGAVFEDIDLDSEYDLLFSQNYVDNPIHKYLKHMSQVLLNVNGKFKRTHKFPNFNFGQTPVLMDIDEDNIKDIIWVNMVGPLKIYKNPNKNNNNYINVKLPSDVSFTNAKVFTYANDKVYMKENIQGGIGFGGDQSEYLTFGLGKINKVDKVIVKTIYGDEYEFLNPKINSQLIMSTSDNK